jgi:tetratricopeptide (TPR) repeat protein
LAALAFLVALGLAVFFLLDVARAEANLALGKAYANRGDLDRAIAAYTAATNLKPRVGGKEWLGIAYGYRGTAFLDKGEPARAVDDLRQALALTPGRTIYQERLATAYVGRGGQRLEGDDVDGAIQDLEVARTLGSTQPALQRSLALAYGRRGMQRASAGAIATALDDLSRALELRPQDSGNLVARGQVLTRAGQYDAAAADFTRALELGPTWVAYYERGRSFFALGRHSEAGADYAQAQALLRRLPAGQERSGGEQMLAQAQRELGQARQGRPQQR